MADALHAPFVPNPALAAQRAAMRAARNRAATGTPAVVRHAFLLAPILISSAGVSPVAVRPVTLADWLLLEALEHPAVTEQPSVAALANAQLTYLLAHHPRDNRSHFASDTLTPSIAAWLDPLDPDLFARAVTAAHRQLHRATITVIKGGAAAESKKSRTKIAPRLNATGWLLYIAETCLAEYHLPEDYLHDELPVARLFGYWTALHERKGQPLPGPSYVEQDITAARRAATTATEAAAAGCHPERVEGSPA